ncbi:MAG: SpoIIE family protein phosphatase [Lachnospiraceae bacterium]|nr:SpoIIE family protein phosphatase [Lachnospiraceae bacterium]
MISFAAAAALGFFFQNLFSRRQAFTLLGEYIDDFQGDWDPNADLKIYVEEFLDDVVLSDPDTYRQNEKLKGLIDTNGEIVSELTVIDTDGVVVASSNPDIMGRNFFEDGTTSAFRCLFEGEDYYAMDYDPNPFAGDDAPELVYAGRPFFDGSGIILMGFNEDIRWIHITADLYDKVYNSRIGATGYLLVCHPNKTINGASYTSGIEEEGPFEKPELLPENDGEVKKTVTELYGKKSYVSALRQPDYYLVAVYPANEADDLKEKNNSIFVGLILLVFSSLFIVLIAFINNHIISQVKKIHGSLKKITDGDLDERANAGGSVEFYDLSGGINDTVEKLEDMIQQAKDQMAEELMNAKRIQESAVPQKFPENEAFGIYASMNTAESVGGDFYDFFMCGEDTLVFAIADVSGKGMPAALYMMRAKTLIRTYAMQGLPVEEVAAMTN